MAASLGEVVPLGELANGEGDRNRNEEGRSGESRRLEAPNLPSNHASGDGAVSWRLKVDPCEWEL